MKEWLKVISIGVLLGSATFGVDYMKGIEDTLTMVLTVLKSLAVAIIVIVALWLEYID